MEKRSWNKNLKSAAKAKKDEFYTQLGDIERELGHYIILNEKLFFVIVMIQKKVIFIFTLHKTLNTYE